MIGGAAGGREQGGGRAEDGRWGEEGGRGCVIGVVEGAGCGGGG